MNEYAHYLAHTLALEQIRRRSARLAERAGAGESDDLLAGTWPGTTVHAVRRAVRHVTARVWAIDG